MVWALSLQFWKWAIFTKAWSWRLLAAGGRVNVIGKVFSFPSAHVLPPSLHRGFLLTPVRSRKGLCFSQSGQGRPLWGPFEQRPEESKTATYESRGRMYVAEEGRRRGDWTQLAERGCNPVNQGEQQAWSVERRPGPDSDRTPCRAWISFKIWWKLVKFSNRSFLIWCRP